MKKILIVLFLGLHAFSASAQLFRLITRPDSTAVANRQPVVRLTRQQLADENSALRLKIDSLMILVDSLRERKYIEDSELEALLEGNKSDDSNDLVAFEYSAEVSDSLLHLWYENSLSSDFQILDDYNMDSLLFSSNVPDAEIEKRLKDINSYITLPYDSRVKNYIILYSEKMKDRMGAVMGKSQYYFPIIEETLSRYDLPVELKYLAVIESMLNPTATSKAGARGLWQFIYRTGLAYGLQINSYVDERLDPVKSIDAAARYLKDAYTIFGDWPLAISSYNCGAGNVSKAIRRAGGKRDFWSIYPYLPRETRGYMPAFVGAMYAMTYYREYGIVPQNVGMPASTDTFEIRRNLHFEQINKVVGVPMEDLRNLNPCYTRDIIPGNDKAYVLNLPYSWTNAFVEAQDSVYKYKADSLFTQAVIKNVKNASTEDRVAYKVKSGDYLGRIASRYGVTVNQIKSWNNLRSSNIRVGQTLYIYRNGTAPKTASSSSAKSASSTAQKSSSATASTYTVKSGDSLYTIAKKYPGVSAQNIKDANGLTSNNIKPGQKLKIPKGN